MGFMTLVGREILHRRLNFILGLLAVVVSVLCFGGAVLSLRSFDLRTEEIVAKEEERTAEEMRKLTDQMRKTMKGLGFNIYIFPEDQDMAEVYSQGYGSKTMPEEYVHRLAEGDVFTVNHLLPSLTRKVKWPEKARTVVLIGIRGEVPQAHRVASGTVKKPLINPVEKSEVVVGDELAKSLNIKPGDVVKFMGEDFKVKNCNEERGNVDDITIWMDLGQAQRLLHEEGRINAILALECNCGSLDQLEKIHSEIESVLPGTKVVEHRSKALARAKARKEAREHGQRQIAAIKKQRAELKQWRERFANVIVPVVLILSFSFVMYLIFMNVRERVSEIGILLAVGVSPVLILLVFLAKAFLMGLVGGALGIAALLIVGASAPGLFSGFQTAALARLPDWISILVVTPFLACLAAWLPALVASREDPAVTLRND